MSVDGTARKTIDNGIECEDCDECLEGDGTLGFGVAGDVGCYIGLDVWGLFGTTLGCKGCGQVGVDIYGGVKGQTGECGDDLCAFAGVKANASATTPCVGFSLGFIGMAVQCTASADACAEGGGCPTCSSNCSACADANAGVSCNVSSSGTCN